jgi:hypothetical protein
MEPTSAPTKLYRRIIMATLAGVISGTVGYYVGKYLSFSLPKDQLLAVLGLPQNLSLSSGDVVALIFASLWIGVCLVSTILFLTARFNSKVATKFGVLQQVGSGQIGHQSMTLLAQFYGANGGLVMLLVIARLWQLSSAQAIGFVVAGVLMSVAMIHASIHLWGLLDELIKTIWLESVAVTCGIVLILAIVATLADLVGLGTGITGFQTIIAYHFIYLLVYFWISVVRAPETLGLLAEERK